MKTTYYQYRNENGNHGSLHLEEFAAYKEAVLHGFGEYNTGGLSVTLTEGFNVRRVFIYKTLEKVK